MTLSQAKKILGKEVSNCSDEDIQRDIEAAELLKNLFFNLYPKLKNKTENE